MFKHDDLLNRYELTAPINGGTVEMNMKTPNQGEISNFYINKDIEKGPLEFFSIYEKGLVIFARQTAEKIEIYSNAEFDIGDDGVFVLVESSLTK